MLERGLSKAEVARELGISRRTVYHWIGTGQRDRELDEASARYGPHPPVARKIDAFRGIIDARLSEFPSLTATRLFAEIRAAGYAGGYTQVKDYVPQVRQPRRRTPSCASRPPRASRRRLTSPSGSISLTYEIRKSVRNWKHWRPCSFALRYGERMVLGMLSRFEP